MFILVTENIQRGRCELYPVHIRPSTYKLWSQESLDAALRAVEVDGVSVHCAALLHGLPKSTLQDHASDCVSRLAKSGPKPYLSVARGRIGKFSAKVCNDRLSPHLTTGYCYHATGCEYQI